MERELNGINAKLDAKWVKTESGAEFLCPVAILEFIDELSEDELKTYCVKGSVYRHIN